MALALRTKKEKVVKTDKKSFADKYNALCYRTLGKRLEPDNDKTAKLAARLRQADMNLTPGMYLARNYITALIVATASFFPYFFIFAMMIDSETWFVFTLALTAVSGAGTLMVFPLAVTSRISNKASKIEQELPFTLSELSILASTGLSPVEIVRKIAKREESVEVSGEFKRAVYKIDIEGKDIITALSETARDSPSNVFRETIWDLANMIHQGGDLDGYLRNKADDVMKSKRFSQKAYIEQLATYSEIYVTLVLLGILLIGVGAFLVDALGINVMGLTSDMLLLGLTFGLLPMAIIVIGILVSATYSRTE
ncbi:type II secretion system F family protein [Methanomassiliicoccus luminyensis]|uniref:type II secretion system F family protein n=1 Tax=Methanomassiliicoccus luminyensis TaxID=1080712 RepID=UPI000360EE41|nr:type II secretion system F family protein [Methanomassiliicoccus luminyensis]